MTAQHLGRFLPPDKAAIAAWLSIRIGRTVETAPRSAARRIGHRVLRPFPNSGLAPADAARADLDVCREGAFLHPAVERGAGQAGYVDHRLKAENAVGLCGLHWRSLPSYVFRWCRVWKR